MGQVNPAAPTPALVGASTPGVYNFTVSAATNAGDLLCARDGGVYTPALASAGVAAESLSTGLVGLGTPLSAVATGVGDNFVQQSCVLTDGNVAHIVSYPASGATMGAYIRSPSGAQLSFTTLAPTTGTTSALPARIFAMPAGRYCIAYFYASTIYFRVYNQSGTLFVGEQSAGLSLSQSSSYAWTARLLTNGDIFFATFTSVTATPVQGQRFNSAGVAQGVFTIASGTVGTPYSIHSCANANGDWTVFYNCNGLTTKLARGNGNTVNLNVTSPYSTAAAPLAGFRTDLALVELGNGNIVSQYGSNSFVAYSSALVPITGALTTGAANMSAMTPMSNGGFALGGLINTSPGTFSLSLYDATGTVTLANAVVAGIFFPGGNAASPSAYETQLFQGGGNSIVAVILSNFFDGSANYYSSGQAVTIDYSGNVLSKSVYATPGGSALGTSLGPFSAVMSGGILQISQHLQSAGTITHYAARTSRSAFLGVAQTAAAAGQTIPVATVGQFTLPSAQTFSNVLAPFNANFAPLAGNKGVVVGNSITLFGVAPPTATPIN